MGKKVGVMATSFFKGIGQHQQAVESPLIVDSLGHLYRPLRLPQ